MPSEDVGTTLDLSHYHKRLEAEAAEHGLTLDEYEAKKKEEREERLRADERSRKWSNLVGVREHLTDKLIHALLYDGELEKTEAIEAVVSWTRAGGESPPILVLTGGTGCGKTFACAYAIAHCLRSVEYVRASHLAERYEPYSGDRERGIEPMNMGAFLLVVDDVGTERRSRDGRRDPRFMPALSDVVDSRMRKHTIITTNLSEKEFFEQYADPRIASRLAQLAHFHGCGVDDMRRRG